MINFVILHAKSKIKSSVIKMTHNNYKKLLMPLKLKVKNVWEFVKVNLKITNHVFKIKSVVQFKYLMKLQRTSKLNKYYVKIKNALGVIIVAVGRVIVLIMLNQDGKQKLLNAHKKISSQ